MNHFLFNHLYENNLISESDILSETGNYTFYIDFTRDINYYPYELVRHCTSNDEFYYTMYEWVESESWEQISGTAWDIAYDALVNFLDGDEATAFTVHLLNEHLVENLIDVILSNGYIEIEILNMLDLDGFNELFNTLGGEFNA